MSPNPEELLKHFKETYCRPGSHVLDAWFDGEFIIYHLHPDSLSQNPVPADFQGTATVITLSGRNLK